MFNPSFYIGRNINAEVVSNSASGGIVSLVAEHIIDSGGIVYGATFDASLLSVHHIRITSKDDLGKIRKSKYVWSDIRCILSSIEGDLKGGEQVLFIGTPCQTATLKKRFNTYNNLLILDIFCHGTIQPEIFTQYLKGLNAQIENVDFRHPSESGKHNFVFSIEDKENKKIVHNDYGKDLITSLFISSAGLRSSCFSCLYCNKTHCSCITVGDVEFEELAAKYGYSKYHLSFIAINNEIGAQIFSKIINQLDCAELKSEDKFVNFYYRDRGQSEEPWGYNKALKNQFDIDLKNYGLETAFFNSVHFYNKKFLSKIHSLTEKTSFYIYGCGAMGSQILECATHFFSDWEIKGFLTTKKTAETKDKLPVYDFSDDFNVRRDSFIIVGATGCNKEEIYRILNSHGYIEGVDYL